LYTYNNIDSNENNIFEDIFKILENKEKNGYLNHSINYNSIRSIELILSLKNINKIKSYKKKIINLLNLTEKYFKTCKKKLKEESKITNKFSYYRLIIKYFSSLFNLKDYSHSELKDYIKKEENENLKNVVNFYNKYSISSEKLKKLMSGFLNRLIEIINKNNMNNNNNANPEIVKKIKKIKTIISYLEMIPGMIDDGKLINQCKNIFWFFNLYIFKK
jgi:NAD(P)H-nitrite reductase large subunit